MINIKPLKAYTDNYIWLLESNEEVSVVDPGDAKPVLDYLEENNKALKDIFITHHHFDHTAGVPELKNKVSGSIYGPKNSYGLIKEEVTHEDTVSSLGIKFEVIEVPGHTLDHIAFYSKQNNILFCGDTLFAGGCGRIFEGTYEQMHRALNKISKLPKNTKIYCGHEYTLSNLKFAIEVEPNNEKLKDEYVNVQRLLSSDKPSLPSTLEKELNINPFLRCHIPSVQNKINEKFNTIGDEIEIFTALRKWKDSF